MTDSEFERLEKLRVEYDTAFYAKVQQFYHHDAVHHGMKCVSLRRLIYPIIFSGKPEVEILAELDKLAAHGKTYF